MSPEWRTRLAQELASEDLYDEGVEASRNACVAGASIGAAAVTAAAFYDNPLTGAPAVRALMMRLADLPLDREAWRTALTGAPHPDTGDDDFTPGFGYVAPSEASAIVGALRRLLVPWQPATRSRSAFFLAHRAAITQMSGQLNVAGFCALFFLDHAVTPEDAEALFLVLRLEPALREAQRTRKVGLAALPFYEHPYSYEGTAPEVRTYDVERLMREVGLVG
ncbi:MAG TPA: hypothetical protein VH062_26910 [Polyangiaceae bacterium]|jgi:hypothetical protein|nr:hypothetical protein [Polyangiaceae bacterium]